MLDLLIASVFVGLIGGHAAVLYRLAGEDFWWLATPMKWTASGKPFTCPVCLGSWMTLAVIGVTDRIVFRWPWEGVLQMLACWLAASAVATWIAVKHAPFEEPDKLV